MKILRVCCLFWALATCSASPAWPSSYEVGQHRALIKLSKNTSSNSGAAWVTIPWKRRQIPATDSTNAVLTVASTGEVIANVLRAPAADGVASREAMTFVFEPVLAGGDDDDNWLENNGTAQRSIVTNCSGAQRGTLACWKAADGKLLFSDTGSDDEGWDGKTQAGTATEWIEFDLGKHEPIDRVGIYSVAQSEDPQWFPKHNPNEVALFTSPAPNGPWTQLYNGSIPAGAESKLSGWKRPAAGGGFRYVRLEIISRHDSGSPLLSHSYIKEIRFGLGPAPGPSPAPSFATDYALYYMPYTRSGRPTGLSLTAHYSPLQKTANASWRAATGLSDAVIASGSFKTKFPEAQCTVAKDSRTEFDAFDAVMEVPASAASISKLMAAHPDTQVFFFPGNRSQQVRMADELPQQWATVGPGSGLSGTAQRGEHFALQAGLWSPRHSLKIKPSDIHWSDFMPSGAAAGASAGTAAKPIPASSVTCYNTGGVDYRGQSFNQSYALSNNTVGALWFGIDVPADAAAGFYTAKITVTVNSNESTTADFSQTTVLTVSLTVASGPAIVNAGADDAWRMARLSWLNSRLGIDRNTTSDGLKKMDSLVLKTAAGSASKAVMGGGRSITIGPSAAGKEFEIVRAIGVSKVDVLAEPITFAVDGISWKAASSPSLLQSDNMTATLSSVASSADNQLRLNATVVVSYDGFVDLSVSLLHSGSQPLKLANTSMSVLVSAAASKFFMGIGQEGHNRSAHYPDGVDWKWAENKGGENQLWTGSTTAGLRLKLKGDEFDWESPLHMQSAPPLSWGGDDHGGSVSAMPTEAGGLLVSAWSGAVTLQPSTPLTYKFDLLVTPVKTLDTARHFRRDRYYQYGYNGHADCNAIAALGVKVLNLHQGVDLNPYINYPFEHAAMEKQSNFSRWCKSLGVESVKVGPAKSS